MRTSSLAFVCLVAVSLLAQASPAKPPARHFDTGKMTGAQEVPPRETPAHGKAVFRLNRDETQIRFEVNVSRMRNVVGGHIHNGEPGANGPIVFGFFDAPPAGGPFQGALAKGTIVRGATPLPPSLGADLDNAQRFDALVALMRSGNSYVNIHTNDGVDPINTGPGDFPGGEIRGQISARP
jgi:hypothetical protein